MADLLGVFRKMMGVSEEEAGEYENEGYYEERDYDYRQPVYDNYEKPHASAVSNERGKVMIMPNEMSDIRVAVKVPAEYDDARMVCDKLRSFAPVIVILEKLDRVEAQRVTDFIMGACYTMDGHVEKIKEDVFLVSPSMINIDKEADAERTVKASSFFSKFSVK